MNGMQNQNGTPQFNPNSMNQIQQAANALQQRLQQANTTPQQYLEMAMQNGSITQDQYQWARQMANTVMGTKY